MKTVCAWCGKTLRDEKPEKSSHSEDKTYIVSHGICEECRSLHFGSKGSTVPE